MSPPKTESSKTLRRRAEEKLGSEAAASRKKLSLDEANLLLHELQVHQIELEMQNEELIRAQTELTGSRTRYFELYDQAPAGYCTINDQGLILEANLTAAALLGVDHDALIKQPLTRFIIPEDQDIFYRHRRQILATKIIQKCELRMQRHDTTQFWAHLQATAAPNDDNTLVCRIVLSDITERKQAEEALIVSRQQLEASNQQLLAAKKGLTLWNRIVKIFLTTSDEVMYTEVLQAILEIMESPYGVFGYIDKHGGFVVPSMSRQIFDKCDVADKTIVFPREKWGHSSWVLAIQEKKSNFTNEPSSNIPRGHIAIRRHISMPIIHHGKVVGLFQVANKETEYSTEDVEFLETIGRAVAPVLDARLQRDKYEQERERLLAAIEQTDEIIVITDASGTIEYVNPAFERITGYTKAEAIGRNPRILSSGKHDKTFYRDFWETISTGHTFHGRMVNKRKDGTLYTEEVTVSPVSDAAGTIINYVAVKRDITEHLRMSDRLQQAQKMEVIGTLAGGIAHDFNNILTSILGYAELAQNKIEPESSADRDLQQVIKAGKRAADLVRQILTISHKVEKKREPVRIQHIIEEVLKFIRPSISTSIAIQSTIDEKCPEIFADPTHIHQVIMNLCTNANYALQGKVGERDKVMEIQLAPITLNKTAALKLGIKIAPGRYVKLTVADTGCGMTAETMKKIFDPYFTTKKKEDGTGLGLTTVHSIITGEGGAMTVESVIGAGSTFGVYLPLYSRDTPELKQTEVENIKMHGTERIMVIDDEETIAKLLQKTLAKFGYQVSAFASCEDAVRIFTADPTAFDLVITDMNMPKIMGTDLARTFLEIRPDIPVILCTGFSGPLDIEEAKAIGIREFMHKPVTSKVLAGLIRKILDEKDGEDNR